MVSLALVPYCAVRLLRKHGLGSYQEIIKKCLWCIGYYLLGIFLAAPILLPSLDAFLGSLRTGVSPWNIIFGLENWLPTMCKEFFFLPRTKRNIQCMLAVVTGVLTWCIPVFGYLLNGFGVQTYTWWVFMLQFGFCVVLICVLEEAEACLSGKKENWNIPIQIQWYRRGIYAITFINIIANMLFLNSEYGLNWSSEFLTYDEVEKYIDSPVCYSDVLADDKGLYRISNDSLTGINGRPENVAMINDYCGLTFWFSLVNGNTQEMIDQLATKNWYNWRSYGLNNSPEYETMAGVKYYFQKDGEAIPLGYEKVEEVSFYGDRWKVYENTNALPLAYVYLSAALTEQFALLDDIQKMGVGLEHAVLECDTLEVDYAGYTDEDMPYELQTPEYELTENGLQISYEIPKDCQVYLYIKENDRNSQMRIFSQAGGEKIEYQCSDNRGFLHNLGSFPNAERLILTVQSKEAQGLAKGEMPKEDIAALREAVQLWILSSETLQNAVKELQKTA